MKQPNSSLNSNDVMEKLEAGTHVLMPAKADGEMAQAIEGYFCNIQRHKKNPNSDAMKADCWCALMAYYAMVDQVKSR